MPRHKPPAPQETLGVDPSLSVMGWALLGQDDGQPPTRIKSGVHEIYAGAQMRPSERLRAAYGSANRLLDDVCGERMRSDLRVAIETPPPVPAVTMAVGVLVACLFARDIGDIRFINQSQAKKHIGGQGKCSKEEIAERIVELLGQWDYATLDETDACAIALTFDLAAPIPTEEAPK